MKIKEILKNVKTISPDDTVKDAAVLMTRHNIGSLVALNDKRRVVGILTERDIIEKVNAKDRLSSRVRVSEIMTSKVITIDANSLLDDAVYLMVKHKIKKLPVIENEQLVGIITSTDIMANSSDVGQYYLLD